MQQFSIKVRLANAAYQGTVMAQSMNAALLLIHDRFANQDFVLTIFPPGATQ